MPHQAVKIARADAETFPLFSTLLLLSRLLLPAPGDAAPCGMAPIGPSAAGYKESEDALRLVQGLSSGGNSVGGTVRVLHHLTVAFGKLMSRLALQLAVEFPLFGPRDGPSAVFPFLGRGSLSLDVREGFLLKKNTEKTGISHQVRKEWLKTKL